ncbi:HEAT repeat domain-containing protein [Streptomyces sp. enrichment culture]|uniref:HEAT repeat domain-containing protein n=1 Tax=Streptomyces sp. enrichment culture TaxID=1795815 RepID=UPI003F553663
MLIGEVARRSGISARMLRHYESLGLVRPSARTGSGYREYSGADIRRIFHIESLRSLGLSLKETARALDDPAFTPAALVTDLIDRTRERIAAEEKLLTRLNRIDAADPADWEDVLQAVALLQALASTHAGARQRAALASAGETAPLPAEALAEAALNETDPNVAGALRWALARADGDVPTLLVQGLDSPLPAVRERAARTLAALPGDRAAAHLRDALAHPDPAVRGCAALALGARGHTEAVPALVDMIVAGRNDTDAADVLGVLAAAPTTADEITDALVAHLTAENAQAPARGRLTQTLGDIPGPSATSALTALTRDEDPAVALTARYLLRLRGTRWLR